MRFNQVSPGPSTPNESSIYPMNLGMNNTRDESMSPALYPNASNSDSSGNLDNSTGRSSDRSTGELIDSGVARKLARAIRSINKDNKDKFAIGRLEVKSMERKRFDTYEPAVDEVRFNYRVKESDHGTFFLVYLAYFHPLRLVGLIIALNIWPLRAWVSLTYLLITTIAKAALDVILQNKKRIFRSSMSYGLSLFLEFQIFIVCVLLLLPKSSGLGGLLAYLLVIIAPIDWLWYFWMVYSDYKAVKKIPNDNDYRVWKLGLLPLNGYRWYKSEPSSRKMLTKLQRNQLFQAKRILPRSLVWSKGLKRWWFVLLL